MIFSMAITNRRPASDSRKLNYRIVYEVDEINVTRACGVIDEGQLEESKEQGTSSTMESKTRTEEEEDQERNTDLEGSSKYKCRAQARESSLRQKRQEKPWGKTTRVVKSQKNDVKKQP